MLNKHQATKCLGSGSGVPIPSVKALARGAPAAVVGDPRLEPAEALRMLCVFINGCYFGSLYFVNNFSYVHLLFVIRLLCCYYLVHVLKLATNTWAGSWNSAPNLSFWVKCRHFQHKSEQQITFSDDVLPGYHAILAHIILRYVRLYHTGVCEIHTPLDGTGVFKVPTPLP